MNAWSVCCRFYYVRIDRCPWGGSLGRQVLNSDNQLSTYFPLLSIAVWAIDILSCEFDRSLVFSVVLRVRVAYKTH